MTNKQSTKVALSELASLEQLLDQVPPQQATDVSKRRAIGMLAPKLYQLRSKGYAWRQVAAWLTDHGIAVTASSLQRYLRASRAGTRSQARRGPTPHGAVSPRAPRTPPGDVALATAGAAPAALPAKAEPLTRSPNAAPHGRTAEHAPPRSEFALRSDTKDL